jgi:hypothetical protein
MSSATWLSLLSGLLGSIIGAMAAFIAVRVTVRAERDLHVERLQRDAKLADERARFDAQLAGIRLIYDAHLKLHEPRLLEVFSQLKWNRYTFRLPPPHAVSLELPTHLETDLGTDKEKDLIAFLDVLEVIEAAANKELVRKDDVFKTTLGYALHLKRHSKVLKEYFAYTNQRDTYAHYKGEAWGAADISS